MPATPKKYGPAYIANSATNIITDPGSTIKHVIRHIHVVNRGAASTFSLYIGATGGSAGGTEIMGGTRAIAANAVVNEYYPAGLTLENTQFLTGIAADASRLVITILYDTIAA